MNQMVKDNNNNNNNNNNNSSNSFIFGQWPQTKTWILFEVIKDIWAQLLKQCMGHFLA